MINLNLITLAIFSQLILTLVPVGIKISNSNIWEIGFFRLVVAIAVLFPFSKNDFLKHIKKTWPLGVLFSFHWLTYAHSVKVSGPSTAVIGLSFYGIILLFYSKVFLNKKIRPIFFFFIIIAIISTKMVVEKRTDLIGLGWGILSSLFYAGLPIINIKNSVIPSDKRAYSQFLVALIFYSIIGAPFISVDNLILDWRILLALGLGGTLVGHGLWLKVTTYLPTTISGGFYYLAIPLSITYEFLFFPAHIGLNKVVGASLIVASNLGIVYYQNKELRE
ncbi:MAG: hypothetical protein CME61_06590 [Halobacteriovoraceae bacterium]|nr:hypothetical protein [Halobacteriovoraceae bacterium]|tara:strand:+ start:1058 stop:1888 length:831 start_codon:yes stop_codon:yes gene_type:complete